MFIVTALGKQEKNDMNLLDGKTDPNIKMKNIGTGV